MSNWLIKDFLYHTKKLYLILLHSHPMVFFLVFFGFFVFFVFEGNEGSTHTHNPLAGNNTIIFLLISFPHLSCF